MNHEDTKRTKKPQRTCIARWSKLEWGRSILDNRELLPIPATTENLAREIVDAGLRVHTALGPGLLESSYEHCLAFEIESRGHKIKRQLGLPIIYKTIQLDAAYRIDLLVEDCVIIEVKAVESLNRVHEAQLLSYLKHAGCRLGFLMNFNVPLFKQGLRRMVL